MPRTAAARPATPARTRNPSHLRPAVPARAPSRVTTGHGTARTPPSGDRPAYARCVLVRSASGRDPWFPPSPHHATWRELAGRARRDPHSGATGVPPGQGSSSATRAAPSCEDGRRNIRRRASLARPCHSRRCGNSGTPAKKNEKPFLALISANWSNGGRRPADAITRSCASSCPAGVSRVITRAGSSAGLEKACTMPGGTTTDSPGPRWRTTCPTRTRSVPSITSNVSCPTRCQWAGGPDSPDGRTASNSNTSPSVSSPVRMMEMSSPVGKRSVRFSLIALHTTYPCRSRY